MDAVNNRNVDWIDQNIEGYQNAQKVLQITKGLKDINHLYQAII